MPTAGVEAQLSSFYNFGTRCGVSSQGHAPAALLPGKRPDTHYRGGCVGRRTVMIGCG